MQIDSQVVAKQAIQAISSNFDKQIQIKQLVSHIAQYNQNYVSKIAGQSTLTAYLPQPNLRKNFSYYQMNQDHFPSNIPVDQFCNFFVKSVSQQKNEGLRKQIQSNSKQSNRYTKTGTYLRNTPKGGIVKQNDDLLNNNAQTSEKSNFLQELPAQNYSQQQINLQLQLRAIQKKLYYTRKSKKQQQQLEAERIKKLKNKRSPDVPKGDFTYETDGNILQRSNKKKNAFNVEHMKISQSFDLKPKDKKSINQMLQSSQENFGRSQLNSRYQKSSIFNNANKRQISHLPFIRMSNNTKLKQENKNSQGAKTQRRSLRQFAQSIDQKSFKHHSQIQKQKKESQLISKLQSNRIQNLQSNKIGKNAQDLQDDGYNNLIKRRQSYLMSKYLKKLSDQNTQQQRKSLNFNRVCFPKNTTIHNYYKHNFNEQRALYESQVISRVLDQTNPVI